MNRNLQSDDNDEGNSSSPSTKGSSAYCSLRSNLISLYKHVNQESANINGDSSTQSSKSATFTLHHPQSLLSHEPNHLSTKLNLTLDQVTSLRDVISNDIVSDPTVGNSIISIPVVSTSSSSFSAKKNDRNSNGLIKSAMTAKDLYNLSLLSLPLSSSRGSSLPNTLRTGSQVLDNLLSSSSSRTNNISNNRGQKRKRQTINMHDNPDNDHLNYHHHHHPPGIKIGTVTEICGVSSSGKTQLALSLAANAILSNHIHGDTKAKKFTVRYIAGGGGNTSLLSLARRFRQLCRARLGIDSSGVIASSTSNGTSSNANSCNNDDVLDQINFIPVGDNPYHLLAELNHIEKEMRKNTKKSNNMLIILDSISGCLSSYLYADGDGGIGAGLMNEISLILRKISRMTTIVNDKEGGGPSVMTNQCAVVITNGMVMDGIGSATRMTRGHKPALGETWRAADLRLILDKVECRFNEENIVATKTTANDGVCGLKLSNLTIVAARLEKHFAKFCTPSQTVQFAIDGTGVIDIVTE